MCELEVEQALKLSRQLLPEEKTLIKELCVFHNGNVAAVYVGIQRRFLFAQLLRALFKAYISWDDIDAAIDQIYDRFLRGEEAGEIARALKEEMSLKDRAAALLAATKALDQDRARIAPRWLTFHNNVEAELAAALHGLEPPASPSERDFAMNALALGRKSSDIKAGFEAIRFKNGGGGGGSQPAPGGGQDV
jgi:hypothetical protein